MTQDFEQHSTYGHPSSALREKMKKELQLRDISDRPILNPTQDATGLTITDPADSWLKILIPNKFLLIAYGTIAIFLCFSLLFWILGSLNGVQFFLSAFMLLIWALAIFVGHAMVRGEKIFSHVRALLHYQPGEVTISQWPLRQGGEINVVFRRKLQGQQHSKSGTLEASLLCCERVQYHSASAIKRAFGLVSVIELESQPIYSGSKEIQGSWRVQIPENLASSLELPHNQVRWYLRVLIRQDGGLDDDSIFGLRLGSQPTS